METMWAIRKRGPEPGLALDEVAVPVPGEDEVLVADLDLDEIREVRNTWQFFRDRRPETYGELVAQLP